MTEIVLCGGPLDGQHWTVTDPPPMQIYAVKPPDPMVIWGEADPHQPLDLGRIVYERVCGTNEYICVNDVDRAQEVINFARSIGLEVDHWAELRMRDWWNDNRLR